MTDKDILEAMRSMLEAERENTRRMMQEENASINARLERVEESLQVVRTSQMRTELEQFPRIAAALDGMKGVKEKFEKLERVESKQEDHGNRILALEFAVQAK